MKLKLVKMGDGDATTAANLKLRTWEADHAPEVRKILADIWPAAAAQLDQEGCYRLAGAVAPLACFSISEPRQHPRLLAAAKSLLRELERHDMRRNFPSIPSEIIDQHPLRRRMDGAKHAVEALASYLAPSNVHNAAVVISTEVKRTWDQAGIKVPLGRRPPGKDPKEDEAKTLTRAGSLTRAVTALLALAGIHMPESTVSDILRGRQSRPRSRGGRKTPPPAPTRGRKTLQKNPP